MAWSGQTVAAVVGRRLCEGLGLASRWWLIAQRKLIKELPCVGAIELAHLHRRYELRIEVSQVDALPGARLEFDRFPVRDTPAVPATDRSQGPIALDVLGSVFGVSFNLDCAELEVDPRPADSTTQRAVAGSSYCGRGRELQFDSATVAGTLMHGSVFRAGRQAAVVVVARPNLMSGDMRPYADSDAWCAPITG